MSGGGESAVKVASTRFEALAEEYGESNEDGGLGSMLAPPHNGVEAIDPSDGAAPFTAITGDGWGNSALTGGISSESGASL